MLCSIFWCLHIWQHWKLVLAVTEDLVWGLLMCLFFLMFSSSVWGGQRRLSCHSFFSSSSSSRSLSLCVWEALKQEKRSRIDWPSETCRPRLHCEHTSTAQADRSARLGEVRKVWGGGGGGRFPAAAWLTADMKHLIKSSLDVQTLSLFLSLQLSQQWWYGGHEALGNPVHHLQGSLLNFPSLFLLIFLPFTQKHIRDFWPEHLRRINSGRRLWWNAQATFNILQYASWRRIQVGCRFRRPESVWAHAGWWIMTLSSTNEKSSAPFYKSLKRGSQGGRRPAPERDGGGIQIL